MELDASGATLRDAVAIEGCTPVAGGVHCAGARAVEARLGDGDDTFAGPLAMRLRIRLDKRTRDLRGEYLVTVRAGE